MFNFVTRACFCGDCLVFSIFLSWWLCVITRPAAHLRHHSPPEWRGCKDRVLHAGPLRRRIHPPHLHPRHPAKAGRGSSYHGQLHGTSHVRQRKKPGGKRKLPARHSLNLSGPFRVWVNLLTHTVTHTKKSEFATKKP